MLDFRTSASSSPPTRVNVLPRLLMTLASLALAVAVLVYFTWQSKESAPPPVEVEATETATPGEEPIVRPMQTSNVLYAVDYDRLEGFIDHSSSMDPEAFYYLLDLARTNSPKLMREKASSQVTLAQLLDEADAYRGQIITFTGRLHRLNQFKCKENPFGIERAYEGYVSTEGGGNILYAIVTPFQPEGIPLRQHMYVNVEVTGYFLGWWRHTNQLNKPTQSPMIIASSVVPRAEPTREAPTSKALTISMVVAGLALAVFLVGIVWPLVRERRRNSTLVVGDESTLTFEFDDSADDGSKPPESSANGHRTGYEGTHDQNLERPDAH